MSFQSNQMSFATSYLSLGFMVESRRGEIVPGLPRVTRKAEVWSDFPYQLRSFPLSYHCPELKNVASRWLQGRFRNHRTWLSRLALINHDRWQDCTYWKKKHMWRLVAVYVTCRLWRVVTRIKWKIYVNTIPKLMLNKY